MYAEHGQLLFHTHTEVQVWVCTLYFVLRAEPTPHPNIPICVWRLGLFSQTAVVPVIQNSTACDIAIVVSSPLGCDGNTPSDQAGHGVSFGTLFFVFVLGLAAYCCGPSRPYAIRHRLTPLLVGPTAAFRPGGLVSLFLGGFIHNNRVHRLRGREAIPHIHIYDAVTPSLPHFAPGSRTAIIAPTPLTPTSTPAVSSKVEYHLLLWHFSDRKQVQRRWRHPCGNETPRRAAMGTRIKQWLNAFI